MPSPSDESIRVSQDNLDAARKIRRAIGRAIDEIEVARERLLDVLANTPRGHPPVIDGRPSIAFGEVLDLVTWLDNRVRYICTKGVLVDALSELEYEHRGDTVALLAEYIRGYREDQK